jgi:hydroxymethylbilane synthase
LRRRSQLLALGLEIEVVPLRGNVDTRLRKLEEGQLDAAVLALAGLRRLGRQRGAIALDPDILVPAPGQGMLALEARAGDRAARDAARSIGDPAAAARLVAERAAVAELDASCRTPVGACAMIDGEVVRLMGYVGLPDGSDWIRDELTGRVSDAAEAGRELARRMLTAGAGDLLRSAEAMA